MTEFAPQLKLLAHPDAVGAFLHGEWRAPPVQVEISPTNFCNARCPWCLVAGTMIDTPDGLIPIESIRVGGRIFGPDGRVCMVTSTGSRHVEEIYIIRCGVRELRVSGEHPVLAETGWKEARHLRVGDSAVVRVRMRDSGWQDKELLEPICGVQSRRKGEENFAGSTTSILRPNEVKQPHEEEGDSGQSISDVEGSAGRLQRGSCCEVGGDVQREDAVVKKPDEGPADGSSCADQDLDSDNVEIRGQVCRVGSSEKVTVRQDLDRENLDRPQEPRLQGPEPEEGARTDSEYRIHPGPRECRKNPADLRTADDPALRQEAVGLFGRIPEQKELANRVAGSSVRLRIGGIELERGLVLQPISSVRTVRGNFKVYNFSCQPLEAYEANGIVVHNCFYVAGDYKQRHSREELDPRVLRVALSEMAESGVKAVTWTGGGDPSVYSAIDEMSEEVRSVGMRQGIFTNGYTPLAHPDLYDWIRITVTEKFVLTKHVEKYAGVTKVGVNFNLTRGNDEHLPRMVKQARDIGVRYFQVRPALADRADLQEKVECPTWIKDFETPEFRIVLTAYKWDDYLEPHGYPTCYGHHLVPFVWFSGDVAVCAYHFGRDQFTFGNLIRDGGWNKVWEGERRRDMVKTGVGVVRDCQHCCKLHEVNKALHALKHEITDEDFV